MDEETQHYARVLKIKTARLHELEAQAAAQGEYNVSPHVKMEIDALMDELGMLEIALESPARARVTDELGPAGRFLVNHQQYRDVKQSLAALSLKIDMGFAMHRNWILLIGVVVILIFAVVVALVTAIVVGGHLG